LHSTVVIQLYNPEIFFAMVAACVTIIGTCSTRNYIAIIFCLLNAVGKIAITATNRFLPL